MTGRAFFARVRPCSCVLRFDVGALAPALHGSLLPEAAEPLLRGEARVTISDGVVEVVVEADDVAALRAGINAYLRSATSALGAARVARG